MQELDRSLGFIGTLIRGSIENGFEMWWQHQGDACGFDPKGDQSVERFAGFQVE